MKIKININLKIDRLVKYFILMDLTLHTGWGLLAPIFPIFVVNKVEGANLITVGITAAIYFVLKSLLQLPIANYLDRNKGEKDDFYFLVSGLLISAFSAFSFTLVSKVWQLYLIQMIHAVGFSFTTPAWSGIFSRHLDKDRMAFDWSLDSTAVGLAAGIGGFAGGILANWFGFEIVFIMAAALSMAAAAIILIVPDFILPDFQRRESMPAKDHSPINIGQ